MTPRERVILHECGHAAAILAMGVSVRLVDTIPDGASLGTVYHDLAVIDRDTAAKRAMTIMAALVEGAETGADLPGWSELQDAPPGSDEQNLAAIAEYLGWGEPDYIDLIARTCRFTLGDAYRAIFDTLTSATDHMPRIDKGALRRLLPIAIRRMEED
jgi:hypothetical protein